MIPWIIPRFPFARDSSLSLLAVSHFYRRLSDDTAQTADFSQADLQRYDTATRTIFIFYLYGLNIYLTAVVAGIAGLIAA